MAHRSTRERFFRCRLKKQVFEWKFALRIHVQYKFLGFVMKWLSQKLVDALALRRNGERISLTQSVQEGTISPDHKVLCLSVFPNYTYWILAMIYRLRDIFNGHDVTDESWTCAVTSLQGDFRPRILCEVQVHQGHGRPEEQADFAAEVVCHLLKRKWNKWTKEVNRDPTFWFHWRLVTVHKRIFQTELGFSTEEDVKG